MVKKKQEQGLAKSLTTAIPGLSTYTLVIWELVPEATELYLIPNDEADKRRGYLKRAHGSFVNARNVNDGSEFLMEVVCNPDYKEGFEDKPHACEWFKYKVDMSKPLEDKVITAVYHSGFIL